MRRQTAQFWAYLSLLTASVLLLATISVSYAVNMPQVTEFTDIPTAVTGDSKPEVNNNPILDHPDADRQIAVRAENYREKQRDWFDIATLKDAEAAHLARLEAARAAEAARAKSRLVVQGETSVQPSGGACDGWLHLVGKYSWDVGHACRILHCESRGNPNAYNPSSATGLFQILGGPRDPEANVRQAFTMYQSRGWQPWECKG